jgi:hypothetical protein
MASYMQSYTNWVSKTAVDIKTGATKAVGGAISNTGKAAGGTVSGTTRNWADGLRMFVYPMAKFFLHHKLILC